MITTKITFFGKQHPMPALPPGTIKAGENKYTHPLMKSYDEKTFFSWTGDAWLFWRESTRVMDFRTKTGIILKNKRVSYPNQQLIWDTEKHGELNIDKAQQMLNKVDPYLRSGSVFENFKKIAIEQQEPAKKAAKERAQKRVEENHEIAEEIARNLTGEKNTYSIMEHFDVKTATHKSNRESINKAV